MVDSFRTTVISNRREVVRFLKFATVGAVGAVVDFGILYLLHIGLNWPLALANTVSFTCAVFSNFTWNRYWTYPDSRSKPLTSQLGQFFAVNIAGWAINTGILVALSAPLTGIAGTWAVVTAAGGAELAHKVGYNAAKVVATGIVMFWNFIVNRVWTYNDVT